MKKITILALHLSTGGIERAIATLSNILAKKYEVEIIAVYKIDLMPAFYIDKKVKIQYLMPNLKPNAKEFKKACKQFQLIKILKEAKKAIRILYLRRKLMIDAIKNLSCDIAISTREIHNKLLGKYGDKDIVKIAQEHNNNGKQKYIKKVVKSLKKIDFFMLASKQLIKIYEEKLKKQNIKCVYIPHCLQDYPEKTSDLLQKNIISIGRLSREKGFCDLIDIFEIVNKKHPDWHLSIAGDGEEREKLEGKIKEKNLEEKITLLGFKKQKELEKLLLESSIYVMTSFHESFGLVLIEAQSYGIPTLAFDSASGPKEIIEEGKNGFLIANRNKEQMANRINELIEKEELRQKMGQIAREKSEQYRMENVETIWYNFIEKI